MADSILTTFDRVPDMPRGDVRDLALDTTTRGS